MLHSTGETPQIAGHLRNLQSFWVPPTVPRDRVSKNGHQRREQERLGNMLGQGDGLPRLCVRRPDGVFESSECGIIFPQMRDEVFKSQEGVTDMGFSPVDEDAALGTNEDIARIEIAVAQGVRNA